MPIPIQIRQVRPGIAYGQARRALERSVAISHERVRKIFSIAEVKAVTAVSTPEVDISIPIEIARNEKPKVRNSGIRRPGYEGSVPVSLERADCRAVVRREVQLSVVVKI